MEEYMKIEEIDKNFKLAEHVEKESLQFYDVEEKPFQIYGLMCDGDKFCRMPESVAITVSESVRHLSFHTSGGRIRFTTDSSRIAILAEVDGSGKMPHMPLTGSHGFDMYVDSEGRQRYFGTFPPPMDIGATYSKYEGNLCFSDKRERVITIHFPLYTSVKKVFVGLDSDSLVKEAPDYTYKKPIVYYGSSITQGGCASRPGNSYPSIISCRLGTDYTNLGFSGSAKAEEAMAEYISNLDMSLLVCDYDYNAPDVEYLRETHLPFYRRIREKQPELPILFLSMPDVKLKSWMEELKERQKIVRDTYLTALEEGDKNVYYIDGVELFDGEDWDLCTVDGTHPNDFGFYCMARRIEKEITRILANH